MPESCVCAPDDGSDCPEPALVPRSYAAVSAMVSAVAATGLCAGAGVWYSRVHRDMSAISDWDAANHAILARASDVMYVMAALHAVLAGYMNMVSIDSRNTGFITNNTLGVVALLWYSIMPTVVVTSLWSGVVAFRAFSWEEPIMSPDMTYGLQAHTAAVAASSVACVCTLTTLYMSHGQVCK